MVTWHEVPGIRKKKEPSRRDGMIVYPRGSLQRSSWQVLSSVTESTAAPTQNHPVPPGRIVPFYGIPGTSCQAILV
jgi:hypothetical protein